MTLLLEEFLPFLPYAWSQRKLLKRASDSNLLGSEERHRAYWDLDTSKLDERIREEHVRAIEIDEKTTKFTLTFSIAFSVIGAIGVGFSKQSGGGNLKHWLAGLLCLATIYMILGGLIALGALKTLPKHGYGTLYYLTTQTLKARVQALVGQETVNTVRHLRNEASYQCLRNGLICLALSVPLMALDSSRDSPPPSDSSTQSLQERRSDHSSGVDPNDIAL